MSSLGGFFDRLRGQLAEMSEVVSGSRALGILDEQIRATDEQLRNWRRMRDVLKAHRVTAHEQLDTTVAKIHQRESQAVAALRAGQEPLAREVASAIVELERARNSTQSHIEIGDLRMAELQHLIERAENSLRRLKHRLDLTHAAETVAKAEASLVRSAGEGMHIPTAVESADLLRQRNAEQGQTHPAPAAEDNVEGLLDAKLQAAGIGGPVSPVDVVLQRLGVLARADTMPARRTRANRSRGKP